MSIAKPQRPTLVDTLSAGYRALNRRPLVLGIPAGLSAYLWLGTPLAMGAAPNALEDSLRSLLRLVGGDKQLHDALVAGILASDARLALAWLNFVPVFAPKLGASSSQPAPIELNGPLQLLASIALVNLLALLLSSLFLTMLSGAVRGERLRVLAVLRRSLQVAANICLYLLALVGVGLVLALPFLAISALVIAALPSAAALVMLAWYIVLFWAYVYTGFAPEAILMSGVGPLRAIYHSVNVVRRNMLGTLGLLLLSFLIVSGLGVVWQQIVHRPVGVVLAILGSAYVGSGLSAARLEFYGERFVRWRGKLAAGDVGA